MPQWLLSRPLVSQTHAAGAVNVQLYGPLTAWDFKSVMKRAVYAVNGMTGSQENAAFTQEVAAAIPDKAAPVAVICDAGGSHIPVPGFPTGKRSRSILAIHKLLEAGYTNVSHVDGGLRVWGTVGCPVEGTEPGSWQEKASQMP